VGDPSGKSAERNMLSPEQINHNLAAQKKQLEKFLDFEGDNPAIIVNNYDWFKDFSFLEFIREAGKHISVNYMMAKDSVKNRLETGMSFTEFCYQLIQGYDFYYLWKNHDVKLQMGGSDQWGNITTGTELIRRKAAGSAYALTTPLIKKSDGTKFGKSEGGNIWLDKTKTSPYKFYQFWLNAADADAENYIKIFSIKTQAEIETLIEEHRSAPHERKLQRALAEEITLRVHSAEDLQAALEASEILFGKATSEQLKRLSDDDFLAVFEGVPQASVSVDRLMGTEVVDVLSELTGFLPSKSEARRALKENSISINKDKIDAEARLNESHLINNKFVLLQRGKKNYFVIRVD
jgi:tyrosyl-tRNA synthetase